MATVALADEIVFSQTLLKQNSVLGVDVTISRYVLRNSTITGRDFITRLLLKDVCIYTNLPPLLHNIHLNILLMFALYVLTFIMVALCNRADRYIFALLFLSVYLSFFFSSPNLIGRTLDVYHTLTHDVALVRI